MTAIVGILNKRGVAIAADSAVTVSSGGNVKIYNTCQKIFKLSDKNPLALMIYGKASFMGVPWEVIINLYRDERGERTFDAVQDYASDFLKFLGDLDFVKGEEDQRDYLMREMYTVYNKLTTPIQARAEEDIELLEDPTEEDAERIYLTHSENVHKEFADICNNAGKVEGLSSYTYKRFCKTIEEPLEYVMKEVIEENWDEKEKEVWQKSFFNYLTSKTFYNQTGLVFIGFGSKDIYPSSYSVSVSGIINGCLRWLEDDKHEITNKNSSLISPYAQTDVMMTMMKGIAPAFYSQILESHKSSLDKTKEKITALLSEAGVSEDIMKRVADMETDDIQKSYDEELDDFMKENYIQGVVDAVDSFNLEDMTNMAESLISITNLQRHFSSSEESVGGPIEVAIITRGGGFKWVKHRNVPAVD
ncbi:MAG: hypothetical protein IK085_10350 [Clostridia bacterium]|nr:hypothetical protein [Clostridia bacterium]